MRAWYYGEEESEAKEKISGLCGKEFDDEEKGFRKDFSEYNRGTA